MEIIENNLFKIEINPNGGALNSIYDKVNNKNLMYEPDIRSWSGKDVVIFPFVARLKDSKYLVDGKEYFLKNHGVIRYEVLNVKRISKTELSCYLKYNEKTLSIYPYKFYFEVNYKLIFNELFITYKIKNLDDKDIYYSFGGHPALKVSGIENEKGFEFRDTHLLFLDDIKTKRYVLNEDGSLIVNKIDEVINKDILVNKKMIVDAKTLIYDAKNINNVILKTNGYSFSFNIKKCEVLAIWTMEGFGDYICVEPWWGIPDYENPNLELKDKPLIHKLSIGKEEVSGYSIRISK